MCGISFSLGESLGRFQISASFFFQDYPVSLSLILTRTNYISLGVLKTCICSAIFNFVLILSPLLVSDFLVVFSAGLYAITVWAALTFGRQRSVVSPDSGTWPLLIFERQQEAVGPFSRGVQGVFSPSTVSSALGFDQHFPLRLPSPLV